MKKLMFTLAALVLLPTVSLFARGVGHAGYDHHRDQSNNWNGGVYGGYDGYISPYPNAQSQPGMGDDSNALYHSYLKSNSR